MKKILSLFLACALCISLFVACGTRNNEQTELSKNTTATTDNETIESTPSEETISTEPKIEETVETEPEKDPIYNVLLAEALSPKFTYASNENCSGYSCGGIDETDNNIYVVAIRVIADTDVSHTYDITIPSLNDGQYYVTEKVQSYIWSESSWYENAEASLYDTVYVIEYTTEEDKDIWVESCTGEQIINLSDISYDKAIKTNGDVEMYECAMVEDEYGTKQYIIPVADSSDYANVGQSAEDIGQGWYGFNLIQIGAVENVPADLEHIQQFYWHPENVSIEYDGFKYSTEPSQDDNTVYIPSSSTDDFEQLRRDVGAYNYTIEFKTKDNTLFKNDSTIYLNFEGIRFCFNIDKWS